MQRLTFVRWHCAHGWYSYTDHSPSKGPFWSPDAISQSDTEGAGIGDFQDAGELGPVNLNNAAFPLWQLETRRRS